MAIVNPNILHQITEGDQAAFSALRSHFEYPAFQLCVSILKDETEAMNLTNSVFEEIWADRNALVLTENFQAYLFSNLKSRIFKRLKQFQDQPAREQYLSKMRNLAQSVI